MIRLANGLRYEAEELGLGGYLVEASSTADASGGKYISTRHYSGATGEASGIFSGDAGTYKVEVGYYDENDGRSYAAVTVDGKTVQFRFDQDLGSSLANATTKTTRVTHQEVELQSGDSFQIWGRADRSEFARFDYIDFIRVDDPSEPAPPPSGDSGLGAYEAEVVLLVNEFRAQNGKDALTVDPALSRAAEGHSQDMALNDFFSHTGSDGSRVGDRVSEEGYAWRAVGENIAAGQTTPQAVVNAWKASSGHRANMLNDIWDDVGAGYYYLANDTGSYNAHHYWTLDFGAPSDAPLV